MDLPREWRQRSAAVGERRDLVGLAVGRDGRGLDRAADRLVGGGFELAEQVMAPERRIEVVDRRGGDVELGPPGRHVRAGIAGRVGENPLAGVVDLEPPDGVVGGRHRTVGVIDRDREVRGCRGRVVTTVAAPGEQREESGSEDRCRRARKSHLPGASQEWSGGRAVHY